MRVAVAGATGVLGRSLIPQLIAAGHSARLLVRDPQKAQQLWPEAKLFTPGGSAEIDLCESDLLAVGMEQKLALMLQGCQAVIHAATAIPSDFNAPGAWTANTQLRIRGTGRLQRAALDAGVTTFLQQSIVMAYPDGGDDWLEESTQIDSSPERADTCYPVAIMESMMRLFQRQSKPMRWSILRGGVFVGPGTFQQVQVTALLEGKLPVPCDGRSFVSLIHVEDAAAAFVAALEFAPAQSIFNICDEPLRYGDYLDRMAKLVSAPEPQRTAETSCPPSHRCSNRAAAEILRWKPRHSIWPV